MLSFISASLRSSPQGVMIQQMEEENQRSQTFLREVANWHSLELLYVGRLNQMMESLSEKSKRITQDDESPSRAASLQFAKLLHNIADCHRAFLQKYTHDINMVNVETAEKLVAIGKKLLDEERSCYKEIQARKENLQKALLRKEKLRKSKEDELILQIFMSDSIDITMDQKIRKQSRIRELEREHQQFDLKVAELLEGYKQSLERERVNSGRVALNFKEQIRCRIETVMKLQLHSSVCRKKSCDSIDQLIAATQEKFVYDRVNCQLICDKFALKDDEPLLKLLEPRNGYVENGLRLITARIMDDLIEYSKDREIKSRIQRMMENDDVNPEETDELCRQVRNIRKMLREIPSLEMMEVFKGLVGKSSKLRMNFVFILQFFRIKSQFQITAMQPIHRLIVQFLKVCHQHRDSFVLKQLMILLMTYYVVGEGDIKVYILHFYKENQIWRDLEYWESILIECIYQEKRNTLRMMAVAEATHQRKQMGEAEKSAILNQLLMVVRNMVIFDFTEKEAKAFALRFIKILKQDERCLKDVYRAIEDAAKEQKHLQTTIGPCVQHYRELHLSSLELL